MSTEPTRPNRRGFLKGSLAASAIAALSFEERHLLAQEAQPAVAPAAPRPQTNSLPTGKIGNVSITRLICGGNLISGFAHSRDLIYVSTLLKQYFTDEKIFETLALCEQNGINTAILRLDGNTLRILNKYWKERGGKIQWIAQIAIDPRDLSDIKLAIDAGAVGVYTHGGVAESLLKAKNLDILAKALDIGRQNKVIAGIAGHLIDVPMACEAAGIKPDFYLKTFNSKQYWSANLPTEKDNVWDREPEKTEAFMANVTCPWIAYKILGAGAIEPAQGFPWAFQRGADFACVGMFDFQVSKDANICRKAVESAQKRPRPWRA